jgi:hypothetical protein
MTTPLALSDQQLTTIMDAAKPLPPRQRAAFLETVAVALCGQPIGDGTVHRVVAQVQRQFFDPPQLARSKHR